MSRGCDDYRDTAIDSIGVNCWRALLYGCDTPTSWGLSQALHVTHATSYAKTHHPPAIVTTRPDEYDHSSSDRESAQGDSLGAVEAEVEDGLSGERRLLAAIIMQAATDYRGVGFKVSKDNRRKLNARAREWLWSNNSDIGSFVWACTHLGIKPQEIRGRLQEIREGA